MIERKHWRKLFGTHISTRPRLCIGALHVLWSEIRRAPLAEASSARARTHKSALSSKHMGAATASCGGAGAISGMEMQWRSSSSRGSTRAPPRYTTMMCGGVLGAGVRGCRMDAWTARVTAAGARGKHTCAVVRRGGGCGQRVALAPVYIRRSTYDLGRGCGPERAGCVGCDERLGEGQEVW